MDPLLEQNPLSQAQAHCKDLQDEYRRLVKESTAIKTAEYNCSKEYSRLVPERNEWESALAADEVAALLLTEELKARKSDLEMLRQEVAACTSLRQQLRSCDQATREKRGSAQDNLLSLPEDFYSEKWKAVKNEILQLRCRLSELKEQREDRLRVEARLAAAVQENEHLLRALTSTRHAREETQGKLSAAETELDCMSFAFEEALQRKREELDRRMTDLIGVGSCIVERESQLKLNREKEALMERESLQLRNSLQNSKRQKRRG